jgi:hypothetical protein
LISERFTIYSIKSDRKLAPRVPGHGQLPKLSGMFKVARGGSSDRPFDVDIFLTEMLWITDA